MTHDPLRELRAYPRKIVDLLNRHRAELGEFESRYPAKVYRDEYRAEKFRALRDRQRDEFAVLRSQVEAALERARQAIERERQSVPRDPGREAAKERAWRRYAQAVERYGALRAIELAERDNDPLLALEALAEELPAAMRIRGDDETTIARVVETVREKLLSLLPDDRRTLEERWQELENGTTRLRTALALAGQVVEGEWDSVPAIPDWNGEILVVGGEA